jgi:hypothetical protein
MFYKDKLGRDIRVGDVLLTGDGNDGRRLRTVICITSTEKRIGWEYVHPPNNYRKGWTCWWLESYEGDGKASKPNMATAREFILVDNVKVFDNHEQLLEIQKGVIDALSSK